MEHITITELDNGYMRLVAEEGYKLYNTVTHKYYSEAEVKDVRPYVAVEDSDAGKDANDGESANDEEDELKVFARD